MSVFISYARQDAATVTVLAEDLRVAGLQTWLDAEFGGGEAWWQAILEHIRTSSVFVLTLSEHSIRSQPCRTELDYAKALGIPIVPVQIGPVKSLLTAPIAELQVVNYQERTATAGIRLFAAITTGAADQRALSDPLPDPPPAPFAYLLRVATMIAELNLRSDDQAAVLGQLRYALHNEEDNRARANAINLLRQLRQRPDCTYNHVQEIDELLRRVWVRIPRSTAGVAARFTAWMSRQRRSAQQEPQTAKSQTVPVNDPPRLSRWLPLLLGVTLVVMATVVALSMNRG